MPPKKKKDLKIVGGETKFKKQTSESSRRYLRRQDKDIYTNKAREEGYRSRAAYKLLEINKKYNFLRNNMAIADLGCAPGSWCQVLNRVLKGNNHTIVAIDKLPIDALENVHFVKGDFTKDEVYEELLALCPEGLDVVLSDIAPETSGHQNNDHLRSMALVELAFDFALTTLKRDGVFLTKIFQGGEEVDLRNTMREHFNKVAFVKPPSSRKDSKEIFLIGLGFKGSKQ
jgi:23S rRNA (uridine2552-2'-O)-methyltransferase